MGTSAFLRPAAFPEAASSLTSAISSIERSGVNTQVHPTGSGLLRMGFFTPSRSLTATQVRIISGTTAAGATPTLVRVGLYLIAANGDGTLVASTANDTTLLAGTNTVYTRALSASYAISAGQRYSTGVLVVTAATAPTLQGGISSLAGAECLQAPAFSAYLSGLADLPASFTSGSLLAAAGRPYIAFAA